MVNIEQNLITRIVVVIIHYKTIKFLRWMCVDIPLLLLSGGRRSSKLGIISDLSLISTGFKVQPLQKIQALSVKTCNCQVQGGALQSTSRLKQTLKDKPSFLSLLARNPAFSHRTHTKPNPSNEMPLPLINRPWHVDTQLVERCIRSKTCQNIGRKERPPKEGHLQLLWMITHLWDRSNYIWFLFTQILTIL